MVRPSEARPRCWRPTASRCHVTCTFPSERQVSSATATCNTPPLFASSLAIYSTIVRSQLNKSDKISFLNKVRTEYLVCCGLVVALRRNCCCRKYEHFLCGQLITLYQLQSLFGGMKECRYKRPWQAFLRVCLEICLQGLRKTIKSYVRRGSISRL
jgi:hypothetical protein